MFEKIVAYFTGSVQQQVLRDLRDAEHSALDAEAAYERAKHNRAMFQERVARLKAAARSIANHQSQD